MSDGITDNVMEDDLIYYSSIEKSVKGKRKISDKSLDFILESKDKFNYIISVKRSDWEKPLEKYKFCSQKIDNRYILKRDTLYEENEVFGIEQDEKSAVKRIYLEMLKELIVIQIEKEKSWESWNQRVINKTPQASQLELKFEN